MSRKADSAASVRDNFQEFLLGMAGRFADVPYLKPQEAELRLLADSISRPFTLAVFGRMKTGKSSLINALIGEKLAITGVEEATATLNWISYGDKAQQQTIGVHWKDGRFESIPFSRLAEWSGKDQEVLDRVRETAFIQLYASAEYLKEIQIVDTPGTGSVAEEHEQAAREFLSPRASEDSEDEGRKADALLYVFPPVARERDEDALKEFEKTRLPGSDPYNSIGVLHKFDGLETDDIPAEAAKKAERMRDALKNTVSHVIPVSAPLAMVARHAPDSFLEGLLEQTQQPDACDILRKALKISDRWDADERRKEARTAYDLHWSSFKRFTYLLMEHSCGSVAEAREIALQASGILNLEKELDHRFFRRTALIKQRLIRVKAKSPVETGMMILNQRIQQHTTDHRHFHDLASKSTAGDQHHNWLQEKAAATEKDRSELEDFAVSADRTWLVEADRMNLMERDMALLEMLDHPQSFVEARDRESIEKLINPGSQNTESQPIPKEVLAALLSRYQPMLISPRQTREHVEHLIRRIQETRSTCS